MVQVAGLDPEAPARYIATRRLGKKLPQRWQEWLQALIKSSFSQMWTLPGYNGTGWSGVELVRDIQDFINHYCTLQLNQQEFTQLRNALTQKINNILDRPESSYLEERSRAI